MVWEKKHLDPTPWEKVDVVGNVYNRLVIWDAHAIHQASQYFGYAALFADCQRIVSKKIDRWRF